MAGKIKQLLDSIIAQRSRGNQLVMDTTRAKLIFKGLDPDKFTGTTPDDPDIIAKIKDIAAELGVRI